MPLQAMAFKGARRQGSDCASPPCRFTKVSIKEFTEAAKRYEGDHAGVYEMCKKDYPDINAGDEIKIPLEEKQDFGRIAAQTAKQVIIQKLREKGIRSMNQDGLLKVCSGITTMHEVMSIG